VSNEYYNNDTKITPFTKASSSDVDADFDAIATGFDKLPEPHASAPVTKGFAEVFEIVDGTDEAHPAPISQIRDAVFYGTCAGSANTYAITLTPAPSAYTAGMTILFKPSASNTGASTVNVNSLGARNVKSTFGADPGANEIYASNYALMTYDGTNFILLNPAGGTTGSVVTTDDVDDTPVDAATTAPISSNWAYDHVAAADPHTGYVRESEIDNSPVDGVTNAPISSNWAYDHSGGATGNLHLGVGQTWTNVTTSRSAGGTFTNNTGKPIEVAVTFYHETLPGLIYYQSGAAIGSLWTVGCTACASAGAGYGYYGTATWVVPPGHVYRSICNGGPTLSRWFELR